MNSKLSLYYFPQCPFCAHVLHEIRNLEIDVALKDTRENPANREELITLTGKTQVPCLVVDGKPMLESMEIIAYLRSTFSS
mgnify:CR=1 FL=1|jgi:glutaredoxin 3